MKYLIKLLPCALLAAGVVVGLLSGCGQGGFAGYEAQAKADTDSRRSDPKWRPTCDEVAVVKAHTSQTDGKLQSFCIDGEGRILVCWDAANTDSPEKAGASGIQVFSPEGEYETTWRLPFGPQAIGRGPAGQIFVGGHGQLARLSLDGRIKASGASPALAEPVMSDEQIREMIKDWNAEGEAQFKRYKTRLEARRSDVTGIAATAQDVFVTCAAPKGFSYAAYRLDHNFENPTLVVDKLSGCCSQMDVAARDDKLWVAHNGRHRVECYDRSGNKLKSFGRADRLAADGFGGCCEPKNIRFTPAGTLLCAESGPPVVIKQFTTEGKFMEVLANPSYDSGCVRTTVDVSPDGKKFYLLNPGDQSIHVFAANK